MTLRIAVCDDDAAAAEWMRGQADAWAQGCGMQASVDTFPSAECFLRDAGANPGYDILLLDVEMDEISGIDLAKRIRQTDRHAEIIFVTSHFEFCGEGYEVDALHYLIKPVAAEKLAEVLSRAADKLSVSLRTVVISADGETVRLREDDILYVEAFAHYIAVHAKSGVFQTRENISSFADHLGNGFFRLHRSYLASLRHIVKITRTEVELSDGSMLPVARGRYDELNRAFIECY
ncbi:MAG: response regulator transcription factor [Ruminococcaceae bacterium]|nr:response regulator transcription factor [Oscillospiraceae bacterium]